MCDCLGSTGRSADISDAPRAKVKSLFGRSPPADQLGSCDACVASSVTGDAGVATTRDHLTVITNDENPATSMRCWCGNENLTDFGDGYRRCDACQTLVAAVTP